MNWELLVAALIIAIAINGSVREATKLVAGLVTILQKRHAIASMAASFLAARLKDKEYVGRIDELRNTVKYALREYPGEARLKEVEAEVAAAKEILGEIDYAEYTIMSEWVDLASRIYDLAGTES